MLGPWRRIKQVNHSFDLNYVGRSKDKSLTIFIAETESRKLRNCSCKARLWVPTPPPIERRPLGATPSRNHHVLGPLEARGNSPGDPGMSRQWPLVSGAVASSAGPCGWLHSRAEL